MLLRPALRCRIMRVMKKIVASCALAVALGASLPATESEMNRVLNDWNRQVADWQNAVQQAATPEAAASVPAPDPNVVAPELWRSISAKTGNRKETITTGKGRKSREETITVPTFEFDKSWALPGVVWILQHPDAFAAAFDETEQNQVSYYANALVKSVMRVHFAAPGIRDICPVMAANAGVREYELMQKIYNRNTDPTTRACAALAMSLMLNNPMVAGVEGSAAMTRGKRIYYLKQSLLLGAQETPFGNATLGEVAGEQTYRLRYLTEGCIPPQLRLRTAEGQVVSYPREGKVNLLLFWAPEEPLGASIVENLQQLKDKYPNMEICPIAPFQTPEALQQLLQAFPAAQMSMLDDEQGTAGVTYRVGALPLAVLISERSSLLYIGVPGVELQNALDKALAPKTRPKVLIEPADAEPVIQPGSQAKPAAEKQQNNTAPPLRTMPRF